MKPWNKDEGDGESAYIWSLSNLLLIGRKTSGREEWMRAMVFVNFDVFFWPVLKNSTLYFLCALGAPFRYGYVSTLL